MWEKCQKHTHEERKQHNETVRLHASPRFTLQWIQLERKSYRLANCKMHQGKRNSMDSGDVCECLYFLLKSIHIQTLSEVPWIHLSKSDCLWIRKLFAKISLQQSHNSLAAFLCMCASALVAHCAVMIQTDGGDFYLKII